MNKTAWWKLPGVITVLVGSLLWGAGSAYWYVCKTDGLCPTSTTPHNTSDDSSASLTPSETSSSTTSDTAATNNSSDQQNKADSTNTAGTNTTEGTSEDVLSKEKPAMLSEYYYPDSATAVTSVDISQILEYLRAHTDAHVSLKAFSANVTQQQGAPNGQAVAASRADAVVATFVANGISADRIHTSTAVASHQLDTTDTQQLAHARRVEIAIQ